MKVADSSDVHLWGDTPNGFGATELSKLTNLRNINSLHVAVFCVNADAPAT